MNNRPIGIFDSGVGGLTVLKEIVELLPNEDIIYFGDTARVPYGNKSKSTIVKFSTENILFLLEKKVKLIVVACNTVSSLALDYLKTIFSVPIIGVIESGVNKALAVSRNRKIGVIGTRSTINSDSYHLKIVEKDNQAKVYSQSCPLFVPLVEEGITKGDIVKEIVKMYLSPLKSKGVDSLILGCTHYPILKTAISNYLNDVYIVDSAKTVALHTQEILTQHDFLTPFKRRGKREFYVSDEPKGFIRLAKIFFKEEVISPKVVGVQQ